MHWLLIQSVVSSSHSSCNAANGFSFKFGVGSDDSVYVIIKKHIMILLSISPSRRSNPGRGFAGSCVFFRPFWEIFWPAASHWDAFSLVTPSWCPGGHHWHVALVCPSVTSNPQLPHIPQLLNLLTGFCGFCSCFSRVGSGRRVRRVAYPPRLLLPPRRPPYLPPYRWLYFVAAMGGGTCGGGGIAAEKAITSS